MLDQFIFPILGLVSIGIGVVALIILFLISERMNSIANPFLLLLAAVAVGAAAFALLDRLTKRFLQKSRAAKIYNIPVEEVAKEIRYALTDDAMGSPLRDNWEEISSSAGSQPDSDGFLTLSFNYYFQDYERKQRYGKMHEFILQQDVILEPVGDSTKVELIFHFRERYDSVKSDTIEFKTRKYIDNSLRNLAVRKD